MNATETTDLFSHNCTGDVVKGDMIRFTEAVFGGSFRNAKFLGERVVEAEVVNDSYGAAKQQHTFTLVVRASTGYRPIEVGTKTTRKGRNVYKIETRRMTWSEDRGGEPARKAAADEKHGRGDRARAARDSRISACI